MSKIQNKFQKIYSILYDNYGPQGWWPLVGHRGTNPTKTGSVKGYHPGDYSYPRNSAQRFEICAGAVLTQNTSWPQVEKALTALKQKKMLSAKAISSADADSIKPLIRPAGYFNQKSAYLKNFTEFFLALGSRVPGRSDVLAVKGVGKETADSIMLYAFSQPEFVVDAYTKRIFSRMGLVSPGAGYDEIKSLFQSNLEQDAKMFQEYHALIVEHAKRHCRTKPECDGCPVSRLCGHHI
ncbi:endonuclease III domain-containing protein [Candidatus Woesearchaeota archaeon]|nr:endonuclease III domain-containing protein [Candidatus Woesearchaeota archaeon]